VPEGFFVFLEKLQIMKTPILLLLFFLSFQSVFSQQLVRKGFHFYLDEAPLDKTELKQLLANEPETLRLFQKAENKKTLVSLLVLPGSAMIGYEIGRFTATGSIGSKEQLIAGGGLTIVGLFLSKGLKSKYDEVLKRYNNKSKEAIAQQISVLATSTGLGVRISF